MKKFLLSLLALLLALTMLCGSLIGCKEEPEPTPAPDANDQTPDTPTAEPYVYSTQYYSDENFATLKTELEGRNPAFGPIDDTMAPVVGLTVDSFMGCSITSITIPVHKTLAADVIGNFTYTIAVVGTLVNDMRAAPKSGKTLQINAEEYGLAENSMIYRYITVDLSDSPIVLGPQETLALGAPGDTLIAAYIKAASSDLSRYAKMECGELGMFMHGGTDSLIYDNDLLCFDFVIEKTFESEAAYEAYAAQKKAEEEEFNAQVQALKDAGYKGKKLSIMGDSISTFSGVSNDTKYNSTIGKNAVWNTKDRNVCDWTMTWWGRLASLLEMEICVPNAWSGSKTFGTQSDDGKDSMVMRADQLHQDNGTPNDPTDDTPPDLIIIYMSINDMLTSPRGNFLDSTSDVASATANWFETTVNGKYDAYDPKTSVKISHDTPNDPTMTYANWQEAYAMGLMLIQETYPEAELWVMSLVESSAHNSGKKEHIDHGNLYIRAIANHLGVGIFDQQRDGYITKQNSHLYGCDEHALITAIHPNQAGHKMMTRLIVEQLYKKLQKS